MRRQIRILTVCGILVLAACQGAATAAESTPAEQVKSSLTELHNWLAGDAGAAGWKKFLKSEDLAAQLAKGDAADKAAVADTLAAYSGPTRGLTHARFTAVRSALVAWLAELSRPKVEELPAVARAAAAQFTPVDPQRVVRSKAKLAAAATALDRWLASAGPKTHDGWKAFLAWEELQKILAEGAPVDAKASEALLAKYRSNEEGLERTRFIALRDALREYAHAFENSSEERVKEAYPKQIEELAVRLEAFAKTGSGEDSAAAGRLVAWLEQAGQAPELVSQIRGNFRQDNMLATLSARLIDAAVSEKVDRVSPVRDVILGTQISGTAYTRGQISSGLVPSNQQAAFEVIMRANTYTDTIGHQRSVTICSTGNTNMFARKRLLLDSLGLRSEPAVASCSTATSINGIGAPLRIVERIAWRKAGKSKGQAEAIASGKAEAQVAEQMDSRLAELVENANENYVGKVRNPLLRRGEFPKKVQFITTRDRIEVRALQQNATQLAAPGAPPALTVRHDMGVRVHESLVGNFAEGIMGGETLTDVGLADLLREATGSVPEELQLSPDKDPWSITFVAERPLTVVFADETVKIALRGQRFTRGDNAITDAMQISATYKIEQTGVGVKLVRQGEVAADYIKPGKLSLLQVTFKTFMRRKFDALFKPEFDRAAEGLKLPGRLESAGTLEVAAMSADKGWLTSAWKMPDQTRTAQAKEAP